MTLEGFGTVGVDDILDGVGEQQLLSHKAELASIEEEKLRREWKP